MENIRNDTNQIIKDLKADLARKELVIERLKWRNRNQKAEIRRLNTAHIVKNNVIDRKGYKIYELEGQLNAEKGSCCGKC